MNIYPIVIMIMIINYIPLHTGQNRICYEELLSFNERNNASYEKWDNFEGIYCL